MKLSLLAIVLGGCGWTNVNLLPPPKPDIYPVNGPNGPALLVKCRAEADCYELASQGCHGGRYTILTHGGGQLAWIDNDGYAAHKSLSLLVECGQGGVATAP